MYYQDDIDDFDLEDPEDGLDFDEEQFPLEDEFLVSGPVDHVGECDICCEDDLELLRSVKEKGIEQWEKVTCDHYFCQACLFSWVFGELSEQKRVIRCPEPDCKSVLLADDIKRIAPELEERFLELSTEEYGNRLDDLDEEAAKDPALAEYLNEHVQICPRCNVVIERSEGCNHMVCHCGVSFCFECGKETCDGTCSQRDAIWEHEHRQRAMLDDFLANLARRAAHMTQEDLIASISSALNFIFLTFHRTPATMLVVLEEFGARIGMQNLPSEQVRAVAAREGVPVREPLLGSPAQPRRNDSPHPSAPPTPPTPRYVYRQQPRMDSPPSNDLTPSAGLPRLSQLPTRNAPSTRPPQTYSSFSQLTNQRVSPGTYQPPPSSNPQRQMYSYYSQQETFDDESDGEYEKDEDYENDGESDGEYENEENAAHPVENAQTTRPTLPPTRVASSPYLPSYYYSYPPASAYPRGYPPYGGQLYYGGPYGAPYQQPYGGQPQVYMQPQSTFYARQHYVPPHQYEPTNTVYFTAPPQNPYNNVTHSGPAAPPSGAPSTTSPTTASSTVAPRQKGSKALRIVNPITHQEVIIAPKVENKAHDEVVPHLPSSDGSI